MADPFVAEIRIFPFNFAPNGWAFCNGQLMPISQNTALFSLLGTTYGGDGISTFALPNLQGQAPMHPNYDPIGLSPHDLGESGGVESVALLTSEMPYHTHTIPCNPSETGSKGAGPFLAKSDSNRPPAYTTSAPNVTMNAMTLTPTGGDQPHNNMQPYLTLNFCIALQGVFPPRG